MAGTTRSLERRIEEIKKRLVALGDLRPGSLSEQWNVCGNPTCRCKATPPRKHGPYFQVSYTRRGKSSSKFVRKEDMPVVRGQLKNYTTLRRLVDEWIQTATELADARLAKARE